MCGRRLGLWHASYGYRGKVAGRDKGKLSRLMLIDIPWWCNVGDCLRAWDVGEAYNSCQGSSKRSVVEVFRSVRLQRRRRRFQAERCRG